ncbi:MAG: AGE family epimerase/isomerase [Bacteroidota bacterium]
MQAIETYSTALRTELASILTWWKTYTIDQEHGGFWGEINNENQSTPAAPKGIVLYSRILWTFSAAWLFGKNADDLTMATRAFSYINQHFLDARYGGFYWSVKANGTMLDGKKQIYGQAFTIYGLSEYYKASGNEQALELAKSTFRLIEKYSYDPINQGYIEAFDQSWQFLADLRLSYKDLNAKKSMNTHLHIVEAYANLYSVWQDESLASAIKELLSVFKRFIIKPDSHLGLFFTTSWQPLSTIVSYGHDIEAAWLLLECAEAIGEEMEITTFKKIALQLTQATIAGLDIDGGLYYEYETATGHTIKEKHWWPQAEAMVGFFNAYQLSGNIQFLQQAIKSWSFIEKYLKDNCGGEWYWGVNETYALMPEPKAGFWKCPYHNARACMEIVNRVSIFL